MRVKTGVIFGQTCLHGESEGEQVLFSAKHACMVRVKVDVIFGQTCLHGESKGREGGREGARIDGPTWMQEPEAMAKR